MQNSLLRKGIALGIIVLCVGLSVIPGIARCLSEPKIAEDISDTVKDRDIIYFGDNDNRGNQKVRLFINDKETFNGYTLFSPIASKTTYLINNSGEIIHTWSSSRNPNAVYLLENGDLLIQKRGFQKLAWDGTIICTFEYPNQHHDIEALPNGNVLMIAQEIKTRAEAIAAGRDPNWLSGPELQSTIIVEVEPTGSYGGNIVWEWHLWDHLIQDYDPSKENYGVVADHPELVDINFAKDGQDDWIHANTVSYNQELDQVMICSRHLSEFWVIDHSTTTEEAAGHTGGIRGRGGDILYRWGNPQTYRAGTTNDQKLFGPHDTQWIKPGCPREGNILIFNNGFERPVGLYSSVDEIAPPVDSSGNYSLTPGSAYEPEEPIWNYTAENPPDFYSASISGTQRLPNGNTLICSGRGGYFFEVTHEKEIVWEYINPYPSQEDNDVFKIRRYYPPIIESIPTLNPIEDVLYILNLSSMITDHDTPDENLMLTENSSYADLVGFELHLLYPKGVTTYDIINLTVSDGMFMVYQDIQVGVIAHPLTPPAKPSGSQWGMINRRYTYSTNTTDPDEDQIYYNFSWDDGTYSGWIGPNASGENASANHTWIHNGTYDIRVKAKDEHGAESDWSENLTVFIVEGFCLNLDDFPMYLADDEDLTYTVNQLCGATVVQMNIDYMQWNQTANLSCPTWCDNHGHNQTNLFASNVSGTYYTADEMNTALNALKGDYYNFGVYSNADYNAMIADICYWIDYEPPHDPNYPGHAPGAVPAYGDYSNWMSIRGIHTNHSVYGNPKALTVHGFWVNDPLPSGIGENTYRMASEWSSYYSKLNVPGDPYNDTYVAICEPPPGAQSDVELVETAHYWENQIPDSNGGSNSLNQIFNHLITYAATNGARERVCPYDDQFKGVFEQSYPGKPMVVKNLVVGDEKHDYYIVPYNNEPTGFMKKGSHSQPDEEKTLAAVIVNAENGQFKEASWVDAPVKYPVISETEARQIVYDMLIDMGINPDDIPARAIHMDLVYRGGYSQFSPEWRARVLGMELFI